ncbi:MAG: hypothetical protein HYZ71_00375 [Deltaproteobacteria bacterium]|nr:hypothetical protein [Deltaproteobacteria bacterium]
MKLLLYSSFFLILIGANAFREDFNRGVIDLWVRTFCTNDSRALKGTTEGELVFRCLRQPQSEYPTFINNWFERQTGTTLMEADELLGLRRKV